MLTKKQVKDPQYPQNPKIVPRKISQPGCPPTGNKSTTIIVQQNFQQVIAQSQSDIVLYQKRSELLIKGIPKVIVLSKFHDRLHVIVQNPKTLFVNWVRSKDMITKILLVESVVNCFSELAWVYGHFYIDREMIKVNSKGQPISWIHHNFKMNLREFPVQMSKFSEAIFVRKFRKTLSQIIDFPQNSQIQSLFQLKYALQTLKRTLIVPHPTSEISISNPPFSNNRTSRQVSVKKFQKVQIRNSQFNFPPSPQLNKNNSFSNFSRSKKLDNPQATLSSQKPDTINLVYNSNSKTFNGNYITNVRKPQPQQNKFVPTQILATRVSEFKDNNYQAKNRKLSADYVLLEEWVKRSGKTSDKNFAVNSFSTRVTFSSKASKAEQQPNTNDIEEFKDKIGGQDIENFISKQRLSTDLQQLIRRSGVKISNISEEGEIEMEFDNLFGDEKPLERTSWLQESRLKRQIEDLFKCDEQYPSQLLQNQLQSELKNVLN